MSGQPPLPPAQQQQQLLQLPPFPTPVAVVDPKLSAPRGASGLRARCKADVDDDLLDDGRGLGLHWYPEGERTQAASAATPLDASNKGFLLLQRLGWKQGKGLGRNEDGRVEPVAAGVDAGVRLGLGKQQEDDRFTAADGISRRKLEVEIQADEDPERTRRREAQVQRDELIKQDVEQILKTFYCQVCAKQYSTAMELEEHLSSYDHHHRKRLAEARAAEMERTRDERQRKELKRQQREQQRLEEQIRKAQAAAAAQQQQAPPPPPPPPPPADAAPQAPAIAAGSGVSFGLKAAPGRGGLAIGRGRGGALASGRGRLGFGGGKVNAAFAESSSDEEGG